MIRLFVYATKGTTVEKTFGEHYMKKTKRR